MNTKTLYLYKSIFVHLICRYNNWHWEWIRFDWRTGYVIYIHVRFINRNAFIVIFRTEKRAKMPTGISGWRFECKWTFAVRQSRLKIDTYVYKLLLYIYNIEKRLGRLISISNECFCLKFMEYYYLQWRYSIYIRIN